MQGRDIRSIHLIKILADMMIPIRLHILILLFLGSTILVACDQFNQEKPPPQITAQGFSIENIQTGTLGQFGPLRLRIESMGRVTKLFIRERSYEIDLATTPEKNHFQLFGLENRVLLHTDITLDFQNYINKKIVQPGEYEFTIEVTDKKNQTAYASIRVKLEEPKGKTTPVEVSKFQLLREGKDQVSGSDKFGITWKTVDKVKVTIRISKAENGASKLVTFNIEDYDNLTTREALSKKIISASDEERIEIDTANNAAAHKVVGIASNDKYYLLKINLSETFLSRIGTTVTLDGEYKF